jgi:MoxR-like ATPase
MQEAEKLFLPNHIFRAGFFQTPVAGCVHLPETMNIDSRIQSFRQAYTALRGEIGKVIVGHDQILDGTLIAVFAGGHVLLEGVPGLGKTLLVRTLGQALDLSFNRIQFTPDLMPADILGTNLVMETPEGKRQFQFQHGPIFAHLILAD